MSPLIIFFLIFDVIIIAVGTVLGAKRGLGKMLVRIGYLLIVGVISFFLSKFLVSLFAQEVIEYLRPIYPEDLQKLIEESPSIEVMLRAFAAALIMPFIFALMFGIMQLLSLIGFNSVASRIVSTLFPDEEKRENGKWFGAAAGLVSSVLVGAVLLSPFFVTASVVAAIPEETFEFFGISDVALAQEEDGVRDMLLKAQSPIGSVFLSSNKEIPSFLFLSRLIGKGLTTFHTPTGSTTNAMKETPILTEIAIGLFNAYQTTMDHGGDDVDAITNAGALLALYVDDSCMVKELSADTVSALAKVLEHDGTIFGIEPIPATGNSMTAMRDSFISSVAKTNLDTVKQNLITLFGKPHPKFVPENKLDSDVGTSMASDQDYHNLGIVSAFAHMEASKNQGDEETAKKCYEAVSSAFVNMADNEAMEDVFEEVAAYTSALISQNATNLVAEESREVYEKVVAKVENTIVAVKDSCTEEKVEAVKEILDSTLLEFDMEMDDWQSSIVATCAVKEFCEGDYLDESGNPTVSIEDIMSFFGISENDIPAWAK